MRKGYARLHAVWVTVAGTVVSDDVEQVQVGVDAEQGTVIDEGVGGGEPLAAAGGAGEEVVAEVRRGFGTVERGAEGKVAQRADRGRRMRRSECGREERSHGEGAPAGDMISSNDETAELAWFLPGQIPTLAFPYPAEALRGGARLAYFEWDPAWARPPG